MGNSISIDFYHIETLFEKIMEKGQLEYIPEFEKACEDYFDDLILRENKVKNMLASVNRWQRTGFVRRDNSNKFK